MISLANVQFKYQVSTPEDDKARKTFFSAPEHTLTLHDGPNMSGYVEVAKGGQVVCVPVMAMVQCQPLEGTSTAKPASTRVVKQLAEGTYGLVSKAG
jgi:hypothetical protein